jgi:hypothetical protein
MTHDVSDESSDLQVTSQASKTGSIFQYDLVALSVLHLPTWVLVLCLVFGLLRDLIPLKAERQSAPQVRAARAVVVIRKAGSGHGQQLWRPGGCGSARE